MKLDDAIEMVSEACYHYDGELYENCNYSEAFDTVLEELNNRISKEKIRNYLDARINIVIDDKLNSKDKIQIATDEGIEKLLKMIRQDLLEDKE